MSLAADVLYEHGAILRGSAFETEGMLYENSKKYP
jgi:hypothetical protein